MARPSSSLDGRSRSQDGNDRDGRSGAVASAIENHAPSRMVGDGHEGLTSAVRGASGGFMATVVMSLFRLPVFRALPPTSEFWAQYVGGGAAEEYTLQGYLLHLSYGTTAGTIFGVVFPSLDRRSPASSEATSLLSGAVYGVLLSVFGVRVVFGHLLNRELGDEHVLVFHAAHAVYGLTLGMWLGRRERRGEVYDSPGHGEEAAPAR